MRSWPQGSGEIVVLGSRQDKCSPDHQHTLHCCAKKKEKSCVKVFEAEHYEVYETSYGPFGVAATAHRTLLNSLL